MIEKRVFVVILALSVGILTALPVMLVVRSPSGPAAVGISLTSTGDTYVFQGEPGGNYGSDVYLIISRSRKGVARTFVKFDLADIPPGAKLVNALLMLYVSETSAVGATYECSMVKEAWIENTLRWNNQPSLIPDTSVSSEVPQKGNWMIWDVKESVNQFLTGASENFGWCIRDSLEGIPVRIPPRTYFASRENKLNKPMLEISFYAPKLSLSGPSFTYIGSRVKFRVDRKDYENAPITGGDLRVRLSSNSTSGRFSLSEYGPWTGEVETTIPNGKSYVDFYYIDKKSGIVRIEADTDQFREEFYEAGVFQLRVQAKDTKGPHVKINATPEMARETEVITISVEVSDPSGIDEVNVYQSGTRLGGPPLERTLINELSGEGQTSVVLETTSGPFPGMHTLYFEVEATDVFGNVGEGMAVVDIISPPPKKTCGCRESHQISISNGVKTFTHWDSLATGDVVGDERDEIIVAQDDKGGRLYVYIWNLESYSFEAFKFVGGVFGAIRYTPYDRLAVGNVIGDEKDEILTAVDEDGKGGTIYIYQIDQTLFDGAVVYELKLVKQIDLNGLGIHFTHFDALIVGNVFGDDTTDEVVIARDDDKKLFVLDNIEGDIASYEFATPSGGFDEFRYTAETDNEEDDDNGHDDIAVADMFGDETEEIVYVDTSRDKLYILAFELHAEVGGFEWSLDIMRKFEVVFTKYDAMCVGDVLGDSRAEILIGRDDDWSVLIYDPFYELVKIQFITFTKWDSMATGDFLGIGKEQIVVAIDEYNKLCVSYSEEFGGG